MHWEPYKLVEDIGAKFGKLDEELTLIEFVQLKVGVQNEVLFDVKVVAEGPMSETVGLIVALLLNEVPPNIQLDLIVYDELVIVDIEHRKARIVGLYLRCEDGRMLFLHQESLAQRSKLEEQQERHKEWSQ